MKRLLLKNCYVLDLKKEKFEFKQNILIEKGLIKDFNIKINEKRIGIVNCKNQFLMYGLFDSHIHVSKVYGFDNIDKKENFADFIHQGITQIRDVGGSLKILNKWNEEIQSEEYIGPDIFYAGPMLDSSPLILKKHNEVVANFTKAIDSNEDVDKMITSLKENNATFIKIFYGFKKSVLKYLLHESDRNNFPITLDPGYPIMHILPIDIAIKSGIKGIEHAKSLLPIILKDKYKEKHDNALKNKNKNKENYRKTFKELMDDIKKHGKEIISQERLKNVTTLMNAKGTYFCPTLRVFNLYIEKKPKDTFFKKINEINAVIMKTIIKKQVKILLGTDFYESFIKEEINLLSNLGLSNIEIIKGLTIYPAEFLQIEKSYGSVEKNKKANLLLLRENPIGNIENLSSISKVFKNGKMVLNKR